MMLLRSRRLPVDLRGAGVAISISIPVPKESRCQQAFLLFLMAPAYINKATQVPCQKHPLGDTSMRQKQAGAGCHTICMTVGVTIELAALSGGRCGDGQRLLAGLAAVGLLCLFARQVFPLLLPQRCCWSVNGYATTPAQVSPATALSMQLTPMNSPQSRCNRRALSHAQGVEIFLVSRSALCQAEGHISVFHAISQNCRGTLPADPHSTSLHGPVFHMVQKDTVKKESGVVSTGKVRKVGGTGAHSQGRRGWPSCRSGRGPRQRR